MRGYINWGQDRETGSLVHWLAIHSYRTLTNTLCKDEDCTPGLISDFKALFISVPFPKY